MGDLREAHAIAAELVGMDKPKVSEPVVPPPPPAPVKKSSLFEVLPLSVIELLKTAPHNETIRAVVLAHIGTPIPDEHRKFEDIQNWIEFNIAPKLTKLGMPKKATPHAAATRFLNDDGDVTIECDVMEEEYGTCRYSITNTGRGCIPITQQQLRLLVENCSRWDNLVDEVCDNLSEGWPDYVEAGNPTDDGYSYDDYSTSGTEDSSCHISVRGHTQLREAVRSLFPEHAIRLGL